MWPNISESLSTVLCYNHNTQEGGSQEALSNDVFGHYHGRCESLFLPPGTTCDAVPGPYLGNVPQSDTEEAANWNQSPLSQADSYETEMIQLVSPPAAARAATEAIVQSPADIYHEIVGECEHLERQQECTKCQYRTGTGNTEAIALTDLVDIVFEAAESIIPRSGNYKFDSAAEQILAKKRQQNKSAAAKYRDKQKQKSEELRKEQKTLEDTNRELKEMVASLERDIVQMRKDIFKSIK
uniref:BZIP domain-containing protein n=1 Tax=Plectus sambesii TaxID=2011161 RepID=A0A914UUY7_9BILA